MFNYIYGEIADKDAQTVTMDVNGIGFCLNASAYTVAACNIGTRQKLYTFMQVKEDDICLFGFATVEERNMFLLLTSVSGVGPKVAIGVLSGMDCNNLAAAIFSGDTRTLTKVKGLGKKTAERIVLELREKVVVDSVYIGAGQQSFDFATEKTDELSPDAQKAVAILCSLGKTPSDAEKLVKAVVKLGATSTEEIVNMSFRM